MLALESAQSQNYTPSHRGRHYYGGGGGNRNRRDYRNDRHSSRRHYHQNNNNNHHNNHNQQQQQQQLLVNDILSSQQNALTQLVAGLQKQPNLLDGITADTLTKLLGGGEPNTLNQNDTHHKKVRFFLSKKFVYIINNLYVFLG